MNIIGNKWIEKEFETLDFGSKRLEKRFKKTMRDISDDPEKSIPGQAQNDELSSGSRSQAQAAPELIRGRMIKNEKCTPECILSSHRDAIEVRSSEEAVLLAIQDTMSVNYSGHEKTDGMGYNCDKALGVNTHTCLSLTAKGIPVGILAQSQSTRTEKDERSASEKQRRPIE